MRTTSLSPPAVGIIAAIPAAIVILLFDELEALAAVFGIDGGPAVFLVAIPILGVAFLVAIGALIFLTHEPWQAVWSMTLVCTAALMVFVVPNIREYGIFVLLLSLPFIGLFAGFAAIAAWTAKTLQKPRANG